MMKTLSLAALVLGSVVASAQPAAPTPPGPPALPVSGEPAPDFRVACAATGDVIFEVDHDVEASLNVPMPTSKLALYAGGMWKVVEKDARGKVTREAQGCLPPSQLKVIEKDLAAMTWTPRHADAACAAISAGYTAYSSHGKQVWTQRMCQLEYLDEASARRLSEMQLILDAVSTPVKPPCCKP